MDLDKKVVAHEIHHIDYTAEALAKGGFAHFMLKEIFEQPDTIRNAMRGRLLVEDGSARLDGLNLVMQQLRQINRIIFVACGTSWHAALVGEHMIEEIAGVSAEVEYASEFRYRNPIIDPHTLVFVISQSGETADTLAALREAANKGATVLGICNVVGSSIARETHGGVYLHAGPEIGVASTKAFTSQLTVLALLAKTNGVEEDAGRVPFTDDFVHGIMDIYDETPVRQGRSFWHYKKSFEGGETKPILPT